MKRIPAVFKSATFIFLAVALFLTSLLATASVAPMHEFWFGASLLVIIFSLIAGMTALVAKSKE